MRVRGRRGWVPERSAAASGESGGTFGAPSADRTGIKARVSLLVIDEPTIRRRRQRQGQQVRTSETSTTTTVAGIKVTGASKVVFIVGRRSSD